MLQSNILIISILIIVIIIIFIYENKIIRKSNFEVNNEFINKSKEMFAKDEKYSAFKEQFGIDNIVYQDLRSLYKNNDLSINSVKSVVD